MDNPAPEVAPEATPTPEATPAPEAPVESLPEATPAEAQPNPEVEAEKPAEEAPKTDEQVRQEAAITGDATLDSALIGMDAALIMLRTKQQEAGRSLAGRDLAVAITNLETACMYAKRSHYATAPYSPLTLKNPTVQA